MPVTHTVQPGECLSSVAGQYGYSDWEKIYNHDDNSQLRTLRPNPNVLLVGDEIIIPDVTTKTEPVEADIVNTFVVNGIKPYLNLRLVEHIEGTALSNCTYQLSYSDKNNDQVKEGVLDNDGKVSIRVPSHITTARLSVVANDTQNTEYLWELSIGSPNPPETKSSVAQHLMNMGYLEAFTEDRLTEKLTQDVEAMSDTIADSWRSFTASVESRAKAFENWSPWSSNDNQGTEAELAVTSNSTDTPPSVVSPHTTSLLEKVSQ